jgi:nitroimidazol reductase NimA-like FMN-containing flavoprotein (pyridoxamine 5'-phosphate oxidase superfamily)
VYVDGWIYARTSPGTKLTTVAHHPFVAFEIDDIRSPHDWRSVVVHGTIYFVDPERDGDDRAVYDEAVRHLQSVDKTAFTDDDSTPHRQQVFRIYVDEVTARSARPA